MLLLAMSHVYACASVPMCTTYVTLSQLSILTKHTYTHQHNNSSFSLCQIVTGQRLLAAMNTYLAVAELHTRRRQSQTRYSDKPQH